MRLVTYCGLLLLGVVAAGCQAPPKSQVKSDYCEQQPLTAGHPATQPTATPVSAKPVATYGGVLTLSDADAITAGAVVAAPAQYADKKLRVTGTVTQVCPKKGCWLRVASADQAAAGDIFIKFTDPPAGRLIPLEAVGHDVTVEGTVKVGQMSERAARHFKEDAGAPRAEIEKIVGPQKQVMLADPAVAIEGIKPVTQ